MIPAAIISFVLHAAYVLAAPLAGPSVSLGNATFVGTTFGTTEKFLGIPFAQPP
jgi:acetylcholinesterase